MTAAAELIGITLGYRRTTVLHHVDLALEPGSTTAIMGATGSGKSSIVAMLATLLKPTAGRVLIRGRDVSRMRSAQLAAVRRNDIGIIFQDGALVPTMTAVENVALPALLAGTPWPAAEAGARALLDRLAVAQMDTPAHTLSGGETQRTAIARAVINAPSVIVADEPTAALDAEARDAVSALLFETSTAHGCALLVVTHDDTVARRADRTLHLVGGVLGEIPALVR